MGAKTVYTAVEIQRILGISQKVMYRLIRENRFTSVRIGGRYFISKNSFDEWIGSEDIKHRLNSDVGKMEGDKEMLDKRCYTVNDVMQMLGISRPAVYDLLKRNEFRYVTCAGKFLVSKKSFDAWLDHGIPESTEEEVL